jgi:hypothetical protein
LSIWRRLRRLVVDPALGELEPAEHDRQHIVEVVRDAAGQLADRVHLLHLAQPRLGLFADDRRLGQLSVGLAKFGGPGLDRALQRRRTVGFDLGRLARDTALGERGNGEPAERQHRQSEQGADRRE